MVEPFNAISHLTGSIIFLIFLIIYRYNIRLAVFNLCATACYALSALHHTFSANIFLKFDHIGIISLILGTYFSIIGVGGYFYFVCLLSFLISALQISTNQFYPILYLIIGWLILIDFKKISKNHLTYLAAGGIIYSVAMIVDHWSHEIFHVFVIVGTLCHLTFVRRVNLSGEDRVYNRGCATKEKSYGDV